MLANGYGRVNGHIRAQPKNILPCYPKSGIMIADKRMA
jgi:hypothetical protein